MDRLRTNFGQDVAFKVPVAKVWPAGTQLDPETSEPFDPAVEPLSGGGFTDVVKHVGVITKPISPAHEGSDTRFASGGAFSDMDAVLDMAAADKVDVENATEVVLYGDRFDIVEIKPGSLGGGTGPVDRYVVYLEAK
jgi:hypothetical protein